MIYSCTIAFVLGLVLLIAGIELCRCSPEQFDELKDDKEPSDMMFWGLTFSTLGFCCLLTSITLFLITHL